MKYLGLAIIALALGWALGGSATAVVESTSQDAAQEQSDDADRAAIEASIASYLAAFNNGDAKALAQLWGAEGGYTLPDGSSVKGRPQLEELFTNFFANANSPKMELAETNIEFLSPHVVMETGIAIVTSEGEEPSETTYEVIHVKGAEGWKIDNCREAEAPQPAPSRFEELSQLEWMIGRWVNSNEDSVIETNAEWTTNQNFIVRSFKVVMDGGIDFEGTEIIGWDPYAESIRSWMFDSDGGFGVGRWSNTGNQWTVQTLNTLPDGRRGSATHVYNVVDADTVSFQSIGRQVDGELLPSIESVTIVRDNQN